MSTDPHLTTKFKMPKDYQGFFDLKSSQTNYFLVVEALANLAQITGIEFRWHAFPHREIDTLNLKPAEPLAAAVLRLEHGVFNGYGQKISLEFCAKNCDFPDGTAIPEFYQDFGSPEDATRTGQEFCTNLYRAMKDPGILSPEVEQSKYNYGVASSNPDDLLTFARVTLASVKVIDNNAVFDEAAFAQVVSEIKATLSVVPGAVRLGSAHPDGLAPKKTDGEAHHNFAPRLKRGTLVL